MCENKLLQRWKWSDLSLVRGGGEEGTGTPASPNKFKGGQCSKGSAPDLGGLEEEESGMQDQKWNPLETGTLPAKGMTLMHRLWRQQTDSWASPTAIEMRRFQWSRISAGPITRERPSDHWFICRWHWPHRQIIASKQCMFPPCGRGNIYLAERLITPWECKSLSHTSYAGSPKQTKWSKDQKTI